MVDTKYGYLHGHYGPDMDGSSRTFEWVESEPQVVDNVDPETVALEEADVPGWFAMCEVEPDFGWVGPFESEDEAIRVATDEDALRAWHIASYDLGDDPMGDWHGRNV